MLILATALLSALDTPQLGLQRENPPLTLMVVTQGATVPFRGANCIIKCCNFYNKTQYGSCSEENNPIKV